ncbi:MAG: hypothetical protein AAB071_03050 [Bacteroidota bacterium]
MIDLLVFYIHTVAIVYAFTKSWQEDGVREGILSVGFVLIIFSIGWAISTLLISYIVPTEGFAKWFNKDTMALTILTVGEGIFYYYYLKKEA